MDISLKLLSITVFQSLNLCLFICFHVTNRYNAGIQGVLETNSLLSMKAIETKAEPLRLPVH